MTVLEIIQRSAEFLGGKGIDSPRLHSELLLAHALRVPRLKLYLDFERALTPAELETVRQLVKRRGQREPLQHIIGSTSFCGLEIQVNDQVLIPRPETELLAERARQFLDALAAGTSGPPNVLDFGTGSGCLAIALAAHCPCAQISASDLSPAALAVARQNAASHQLAARIRFSEGDGFRALPAEARFDLIVSNPPYIPSAEIDTLAPEVREHDPRMALDGGPDGLDFYRRLAEQAAAWLRPGGKIMLEFGDGQAEAIRRIFLPQHWIIEAIASDHTGRPRILVAGPAAAGGMA
ncbi:MAG: peptide chain release factor N(5)-glutamine methyltransferase [Chloroflexi bacterium]|nr:peptide chain release factor N(5)-glutamine methyltransferase [Chloroflexota bacterium]